MSARKVAIALGLVLPFLLSVRLLFPFRTDHLISGSSGRSVYVLSQAEGAAAVTRAVGSPQVQALAAQLEARGWVWATGGKQPVACERGQAVLLPYAVSVASSAPPPGSGSTPPPEEPSEDPQVGTSSTRPAPGKPVPTPPGAPGACIVYAAYTDGSEAAFAVINTADQGYTLHLYPDGERRWLINDGAGVLEQLRHNERFRKFENWLRSGGAGGSTEVREVRVGPVLLDEGTGTAHVFVSGLGSSLSPSSRRPYLPAVYPPLDQVVATYLVLAQVTARQGGQLTLDPGSLWLLPRGSLNLRPSGDPVAGALEVVRVGSGATYTVMAGGTKPADFPGLRNFAWFSPLADGDNQLMGPGQTGPATAQVGGAAPGGWGLTVFAWGLGDYPEANVLLQFKTDAELTLAAYNAAVAVGNYGVLGVKTSSSPSLAVLAGLGPANLSEVEGCVAQGQTLVGRPYAVFDARVVGKDIELITGLTLEQIGELLLALAAARDQGQFDAVYDDLAVPESLGQLFGSMTAYYGPRVKAFIRETALEFRRRALARGLVVPQQLEPQGWILAALTPLVIDLCVAMLGSFLYDLTSPFFGLQVVTTDQRILVELGKLRQDVEIIKEVALYSVNYQAFERDMEELRLAGRERALRALRDLEAAEAVATRGQIAELLHAYRLAYAYIHVDDLRQRQINLAQLVEALVYLREVQTERSGWRLQGTFTRAHARDPNLSHPAGIVLAKDRTTMRDRNFQFEVVDVAIIQLHRQDSVSQADLPRIRQFVDTALNHLGSTYWARTVTADRATLPALEIVAVVFSGESEPGASLARQLAEELENSFCCRSEGIVLVTWEENGETQWDCIGASCDFYIYHPELLRALVAELTPRTRERPPAQREHRPGSGSCVTVGGWSWRDETGGTPLPMRYGG